jgi:hypothetical protein
MPGFARGKTQGVIFHGLVRHPLVVVAANFEYAL